MSKHKTATQVGAGRAYGRIEGERFRQENRRLAEKAREALTARPDPEYGVRPMTIDDAPFITDSWATSYLHHARLDAIPHDVYKIEQRSRIDRLVRRSVVLTLNPKEDPSHVSGWLCFEPPNERAKLPILHYILIHPNLQQRGLATQLIELVKSTLNEPTDPIWATHWTFPMRKVGPKWNLIYNPYLLEVKHA